MTKTDECMTRETVSLTDDNPDRCPVCGCEPECDWCPGDHCEECGTMLTLWQRDQLVELVNELRDHARFLAGECAALGGIIKRIRGGAYLT